MFRRRSFFKSILGAGAATLLVSGGVEPPDSPGQWGLLKPKRLVKGQTLGLIAPASNAWENEDIRFAVEIIESLGFRVKPGAHLFRRNGYLAGTDRQRAEDVNGMFRDPEVKGIIALRGGYGTPRILPMIDYANIRQNPKVFIGYSDLTALLHAIHKKTGLVTFHGPIAKQSYSDYTLAAFKQVLMNPQTPMPLAAPPAFEMAEGTVERENRITRLVSGKARGRLIGGNLSLMIKLLGTPFEPDFRGKILVLEDVGEEPYRIDGMLTHLWLAGKLDQVAGLVFGKFTDCKPKGSSNSFSLEEILKARCTPLGKPAIRGLMIGHIEDQATFPLGIEAELDADQGTLTLLENAVI